MQIAYFKYIHAKKARTELERRRALKIARFRGAVRLQALARRYLARKLLARKKGAIVLKWCLIESRSRKHCFGAVANYRRMRKAAVKIQTIMRRYLTRRYFMRNYKKMVKERNKRVRKQRVQAALLLQGLARIIAAKRILKRKRRELEVEMQNKVTHLLFPSTARRQRYWL
jgi:predicted alpha/beta-fold hydrolase